MVVLNNSFTDTPDVWAFDVAARSWRRYENSTGEVADLNPRLAVYDSARGTVVTFGFADVYSFNPLENQWANETPVEHQESWLGLPEDRVVTYDLARESIVFLLQNRLFERKSRGMQ